MPMMDYNGWSGMMGGGWSFVGWITLLLFWTLLVLAIFTLFRYLTGGGSRPCCHDKEDHHHGES